MCSLRHATWQEIYFKKHAPVDQLCDEDQAHNVEDVPEPAHDEIQDMDYDGHHMDEEGLEWFSDSESESYSI